MRLLSLVTVIICLNVMCLGAASFNVRDYGAKGDGLTKDGPAIQAAIDAAVKAGGGVVDVPAGTYLCGTIHVKSHITLNLHSGSVIAASKDEGDFDPYEQLPFKPVDDRETTYFHYALLAGQDVDDLAIIGRGTVDGNRTRRRGPKTIALKKCHHITIRDITVKNSPNYSISFLGCDYVVVDGVTILNGYADGIDPDSSHFVRIANCFIDCYDDAICPKASHALGYRRSTEHLTVTNCVLSTECYNLKFGTESGGDFRYITFTNCSMFNRPKGRRNAAAGVALESVDGANIEGVVVSNLTMDGIWTPVFIRLGARARTLDTPRRGSLKNVSISNIVSTGAKLPVLISGIPGQDVKNVSIANLNITAKGGVKEFRGLPVPEYETRYPNSDMFGPLPAFGVYARHVDGLILNNIQARWDDEDARPAMIFHDVKGLRLEGIRVDTGTAGQPAIWLNDVSHAMVGGSRAPAGTGFLRLTGKTAGISLFGNDFSQSSEVLEFGPGVPKSAATLGANVMPANSR